MTWLGLYALVWKAEEVKMKRLLLIAAASYLLSSAAPVNAQDRIRGSAGSQGDMTQQDQLKLQLLMQQKTQSESMTSNMMKKNADTNKKIIQNLKR